MRDEKHRPVLFCADDLDDSDDVAGLDSPGTEQDKTLDLRVREHRRPGLRLDHPDEGVGTLGLRIERAEDEILGLGTIRRCQLASLHAIGIVA